MTTVQYPGSGPSSAPVTGPNLGWAFDSMGRLNTMTDLAANSTIISGATYGPSSELLTMAGQVNESRSYNSMLQLTGLTSGSTVSMTYAYSSTQNNGKIVSQTDALIGETVQYTYDALNRLASATANTWGQSYQYDGFGNLTNQNVTAGSAPAYSNSYDANNHLAGCADANGNYTCAVDGAGHGFNYDVENRPRQLSNGAVLYSYAPGNRRVWRGLFTNGTITTDEVTFWGANGQKLAVYQLTYTNLTTPPTQANWVWYASQTGTNYYFGGKLIKNAGGYVGSDRLGSIGKFYPWGQEKPSATTNGTEKFTGYFRDSETGNDYAINRYHQPGMGRFLTVDPFGRSAHAASSGSWNRYAYALGDPVNGTDWTGLEGGPINCLNDSVGQGEFFDNPDCEVSVDISPIDIGSINGDLTDPGEGPSGYAPAPPSTQDPDPCFFAMPGSIASKLCDGVPPKPPAPPPPAPTKGPTIGPKNPPIIHAPVGKPNWGQCIWLPDWFIAGLWGGHGPARPVDDGGGASPGAGAVWQNTQKGYKNIFGQSPPAQPIVDPLAPLAPVFGLANSVFRCTTGQYSE